MCISILGAFPGHILGVGMAGWLGWLGLFELKDVQGIWG